MNRKKFVKQAAQIISRAIAFYDTARRESLFARDGSITLAGSNAVDKTIDRSKAVNRDILEYGMQLVVDGTDCEDTKKILSNLINQEKNESSKRLKTIQKEAVLNIQEFKNSSSPRILLEILYSYVDNEELKDIRKIVDLEDDDLE